MKRILSILYILLCIVYPLLCFQMFHDWNSNVLILSIPLLAIGAWQFGSTSGLVIFFYITCISFSLSQVFADIYTYYADRAMGIPISLLVIYLFSRLRTNNDGIRETTRRLDALVAKRDSELSALTEQLLATTEKLRISRGQELHDGIGQQLTGVQLLSSSLATQLEAERNKDATVASSLTTATRSAHINIRHIARALFPVKIAQVGLTAALEELVDCINQIRMGQVQIKDISNITDMQETTALQLYRICQESLIYLTDHCNSDRFEITINTSIRHHILGIAHNGSSLAKALDDSQYRLIQYRLKQIKGTQVESLTIQGLNIIYFEVLKNQSPQ